LGAIEFFYSARSAIRGSKGVSPLKLYTKLYMKPCAKLYTKLCAKLYTKLCAKLCTKLCTKLRTKLCAKLCAKLYVKLYAKLYRRASQGQLIFGVLRTYARTTHVCFISNKDTRLRAR
jgi:hypothetical protein